MARKFQIKRGLKANMPTLAQGEFAMATNTGAEELHLGTGSKNLQIPILGSDGKLPSSTTPAHTHTAADVGARPNTWMPTPAEVGAAPAGIVSTTRSVKTYEELEAAIVSEYALMLNYTERCFVLNVNVTGLPVSAGSWHVRLCKVTADYGELTAISYSGGFGKGVGPCALRRMIIAGTWQPWEWENPPMELGVEYRTTERYLGKPVYVKVVDFGSLPVSTNKSITHGIANISAFISAELLANSIAASLSNHKNISEIMGNETYLNVSTTSDMSHITANLICKYTKSTD